MKIKNVLLLVALSFATAIGAFAADEVNAGGSLAYESQYVFRGVKNRDAIAFATADVSFLKNYNFSATGIWDVVPSDRRASLSEVDLTASATIPLQASSLSVGGTAYVYPKANVRLAETQYSTEVFSTLQYDAFLHPRVSAFYDFNLKTVTFEGGLSQSFPLFAGISIVPGVDLGFVNARDPLPESRFHLKNSYRYLTGRLDLTYTYKVVALSVGVRQNRLNDGNETKNSWYGASAAVRF